MEGKKIKHMKEEVLEDAPSPYSDQQSTNGEDVKPNISVSSPVSYSNPETSDTIKRRKKANERRAQNPEWKEYKHENLIAAINAVLSTSMSVLAASQKYQVPYASLYQNLLYYGIPTRGSVL
ncbi:uncharacterized protein LOC123677950 isoform X5 [Harmonia axyridis]|uniref:uncharacterized protein LOC123677950 isoform X5 n=1 Tax=Harmonia axyridis TaxID=115357 RepID=UPI001E275D30|nr:uncharacterized protein LOC123677950 isoform X5 [Harmonia axyridis]XP_045470657.1 uncharacterized protein LOC123677950 isoform X5 [Harmonia axyridis]